ncbi:hypothetical protein AMS69_10100 [Haloarcula rubripromontorii]|uniref:PIN domain-containing protein n=1 Tax=Haloarcula rubripromontorii TaxID=1705562 RepID=A0A0M9AKQ1_9EURY|nr:type II toxin-antitoxin system VapC family toxin [Haloarcula rubripromontorii]KOX92805.1 hypothetical protein AMS69_10100 [Haloarcula rubripromontorii]
MILDTSFLIDLMNGQSDAVTQAGQLDAMPVVERIPAQVVYELYVGVGYTETPDAEVEKIQSILDTRPIEETTPEIARLAGRINGSLKREGEQVSTGDMLIGATARHFGEPVVTGNPADFEPIPDIDIERY